ncbi:MAG: hypothetical protein HYY57_06600 [Candidatus Omnitrophica bacterium]|nr:hypothetical protein [Candidatus Omnitrophota bacterium]
MLLLRMISIVWNLAGFHLLTPWRSALLRWRLETYGVCNAQGELLSAKDLSAADFLRFATSHFRQLWRFLRWAACL